MREFLGLAEVERNDESALGSTQGTEDIRVSNRMKHYALDACWWQVAKGRKVHMLHGAIGQQDGP